MPVGLPPRGGPMGRTRGRLSASALTTYLRCPRQWLLGYQVGLQGPTRPSQILGVVLEEAFCDLLMMHPPVVSSHEELLAWATAQVPTMATSAYEKSEAAWNDVLWKSDPTDWDRVTTASIEDRLMGGLGLFMSEVEACFAASGGPFLNPASEQHPFTLSRKRFEMLDCARGPRQPRPHGLRRGLQSRGTRHGSAPDLGSKTHACINPSAFTIRTDGLLANWTWSFDGTATFALSTSNWERRIPRSQPRLNTNSAFTLGCGMKLMEGTSWTAWKGGTSKPVSGWVTHRPAGATWWS